DDVPQGGQAIPGDTLERVDGENATGDEATEAAGPGGADSEAIAKLEAEKEQLEHDISWRTIDIEGSEQDLAALDLKKDEESAKRAKQQEELRERKARVQRDAKKAQERGGKGKDPDNDARVKSLQRDIGSIGKKIDEIAKDQAEERDEGQQYRDARDKLQERLQEVEQELAA